MKSLQSEIYIYIIIRPALGPTQLPVLGFLPGVKCGLGVLLTTHPPSRAAFMEE